MGDNARPPAARFAWLARTASNLLVLFALGALAWWGHQTGWKLPAASELAGAAADEKDDWCKEHGVPESVCVECRNGDYPRAKSPGWCTTHGVHECLYEHPYLAQLPSPPAVTPAMLERAGRALALRPRTPNTRTCKLHLRRVQFVSDEAAARAGVGTGEAQVGRVEESVAANGEITYDQTRWARVSARVPGTVWRVDRAVGEEVKKGDLLALVDAAEVGKAKAELLQAVAQIDLRKRTFEGLKSAYSRGSVSDATYAAAESALQESRIRASAAEQALSNLGLAVKADDLQGLTPDGQRRRVRFLGVPADAARGLEGRTATANLLPVLAPLDGVVVAREVVAGEVVDTSKVLFQVADPRAVWLTLSVPEEGARLVRVGQPVRFHGRGLDKEVAGRVAWVSTAVDPRTRTVRVRADLPNPSGALRDHTFGSGRVILREEEWAIVVPSEAVQWEGDCHVVFVRDKDYFADRAPKVFHTRTVRPGAVGGGSTEIIAGLLPGEVVATKGSAVLRAELHKNKLGAG